MCTARADCLSMLGSGLLELRFVDVTGCSDEMAAERWKRWIGSALIDLGQTLPGRLLVVQAIEF